MHLLTVLSLQIEAEPMSCSKEPNKLGSMRTKVVEAEAEEVMTTVPLSLVAYSSSPPPLIGDSSLCSVELSTADPDEEKILLQSKSNSLLAYS